MIWLITGVPGSGKSYFAVSMIHDLIEKHQKKNNLTYQESSNQINVLHNVDGLRVGTVLEDFCAENDINPTTIFTNNYHLDNEKFRGWMFVLDECQTLFPKNLRNEDIQRFFQLHRHYGIDIVLLSQDYKLVCPSISLLSEFQYRAVSDTANPLPGFFMYRQMVGYEQIGRKFKRKKKKVFALYKTADFDQSKVKKKARPMIIIFIICAILGALGIAKVLSYTSRNTKPKKPIYSQTFTEQKAFSQDRTSQQTSSIYEIEYPKSYLSKLGHNTLVNLDTIQDKTGTYFLFMGTLWPLKDFPYKIVETKLGIQALVPLDLKLYLDSQKNKLLDQSTPNSNYNQNNFSQER